jgi:glycosyltransferase involved in cell wall biosynthesis
VSRQLSRNPKLKKVPQWAYNKLIGWQASSWKPYSRLFLLSDGANWSLSWDMLELIHIAKRIGIRTVLNPAYHMQRIRKQSIFFASLYMLINRHAAFRKFKLAAAYLHGRPETGNQVFDQRFEFVRQNHHRIHRLQVTNTAFREVVLNTGIDPAKVFVIPIGINPQFFQYQTLDTRKQYRKRYGIPESAVVIGSFQKDGTGWAAGDDPKWEKGPDLLVKALEILKTQVPELFILLTGPSRGYVINHLNRLKIPFKHYYLKDYRQIGTLYQCLDLSMVSSRDEGGPKAVLESMVSGIPLVTSRVGQTVDIVDHGKNGWITDVEDAEGLAYWAGKVLSKRDEFSHVRKRARQEALMYSYDKLTPRWLEMMDGFVSWS